jgi:hypothetical protein
MDDRHTVVQQRALVEWDLKRVLKRGREEDRERGSVFVY